MKENQKRRESGDPRPAGEGESKAQHNKHQCNGMVQRNDGEGLRCDVPAGQLVHAAMGSLLNMPLHPVAFAQLAMCLLPRRLACEVAAPMVESSAPPNAFYCLRYIA